MRATESDQFTFRVLNDTTSYLTQIVGDEAHATSVGTFGTYTLAAHRLMDVHTFPLAFGRYTIRLSNTSGSVNWGLAAHEPGKPFQNRTPARKRADWLDGNGVAEEVTLNISNPGNYAIVVFKTGSGDVVKSGSYRLQITATTADAEGEGLPQRTRIVSATPAPFRTNVRFGFELAEAADVTIEVLDVMGARRRVLTHGAYPAGRQSVAWDGRDDGGGQLAPGMYLVRMMSPHVLPLPRLGGSATLVPWPGNPPAHARRVQTHPSCPRRRGCARRPASPVRAHRARGIRSRGPGPRPHRRVPRRSKRLAPHPSHAARWRLRARRL